MIQKLNVCFDYILNICTFFCLTIYLFLLRIGPICFVNYEALNTVSCCKGNICTSCYVDLKSHKTHSKKTECPFCNSVGYSISYTKLGKINESCLNDENVNTRNENLNTSICSNNKTQTPTNTPLKTSTKSTPCMVFASVEDRLELEKEIKGQRKAFSSPIRARINNSTSSPYSYSSYDHFSPYGQPGRSSYRERGNNNNNSYSTRNSSSNTSQRSVGGGGGDISRYSSSSTPIGLNQPRRSMMDTADENDMQSLESIFQSLMFGMNGPLNTATHASTTASGASLSQANNNAARVTHRMSDANTSTSRVDTSSIDDFSEADRLEQLMIMQVTM